MLRNWDSNNQETSFMGSAAIIRKKRIFTAPINGWNYPLTFQTLFYLWPVKQHINVIGQ